MTRRRPKSLVKVTAAADICYIFDAIKKRSGEEEVTGNR